MSQPKKKKVVVTTQSKTPKAGTAKAKAKPSARAKRPKAREEEMIFGKQHYLLMGVGLLVIMIGLALMTGGGMDSPDEWDPDRIYGFRRTVLAPFLILAGLVVEIYAIFRR